MQKYHLRPDGKIGRCMATKRKCRYSELPHFDNFKEGQKYMDNINESPKNSHSTKLENEELKNNLISERFREWTFWSKDKEKFNKIRQKYNDEIPTSVFADEFIQGSCISNDNRIIISEKEYIEGVYKNYWSEEERAEEEEVKIFENEKKDTNFNEFLTNLQDLSEHYLSTENMKRLRVELLEKSEEIIEKDHIDYYGSFESYRCRVVNREDFSKTIKKFFGKNTIKLLSKKDLEKIK